MLGPPRQTPSSLEALGHPQPEGRGPGPRQGRDTQAALPLQEDIALGPSNQRSPAWTSRLPSRPGPWRRAGSGLSVPETAVRAEVSPESEEYGCAVRGTRLVSAATSSKKPP